MDQDLLDLFSTDDGAARASAMALAQAMRQRREAAAPRRAASELASVFGGPFAGAAKTFGAGASELDAGADRMQQQLVGTLQHRAQMMPGLRQDEERRAAMAHPATAQFLRQTYAKLGLQPGDAPPQVLQQNLPVAEKIYGVDQNAQARRDVAEQNRLLRQSIAAQGGAHAGGVATDDAKEIARAIVAGEQPPQLHARYAGPVRAELARQGYDLRTAEQDWHATQKHISALNSTQQVRLRQAVDATADQLDNVERVYEEWRRVGSASGLRAFNRAALATAKQLPGQAGAAAQALEGQISLLTGELGNVLMGGNSPTDHGLKLAGTMLAGDWNEETFKKAIGQLRRDIQIRRNSMLHSTPAGLSTAAPGAAPAAAGPTPAAARPRRTVNGETREWDGKAWIPVGG